MKDINDLMTLDLGSGISLWWSLIAGLAVALIYTLLKKILLPATGTGKTRARWERRLDFVERIYWPILALLLGCILLMSKPLVGAVLFVFVTAIFWSPLRNYFTGIVLRVGDTYQVGQRIVFNGSKGVIKAFNSLGIELDLEGGGSLDIPYLRFHAEQVIRTSPTSGVLSHGILLSIDKPCDLEEEKQQIKVILLALPYVLPDQKIVFEHMGEEDTNYTLKVIAHGLDKEHMYKVESILKQRYAKGKMRKVI